MSKVKIVLNDPDAPAGQREGLVVDDTQRKVLGHAHDRTYAGLAFAVHTEAWAGHVELDRIEFVTIEEP